MVVGVKVSSGTSATRRVSLLWLVHTQGLEALLVSEASCDATKAPEGGSVPHVF